MNLKEARIRAGFNQREFSEATHTAQSLVSAIENRRITAWKAFKEKAAQVLGMSIEELFAETKGDEQDV